MDLRGFTSRSGSATARGGTAGSVAVSSVAPLTARESRADRTSGLHSSRNFPDGGESSSSAASGLGGRFGQASTTPRHNDSQQPMSKMEFERARKHKEFEHKHQKLEEQRKEDAAYIKEKYARHLRQRDQRCEDMLRNVLSEDGMRGEVNLVVGDHDEKMKRKKEEMYSKWDSEVAQRIEYHVLKYMQPKPPPVPASFKGREKLLLSDDPCKALTRQSDAEESFVRAAEIVLSAHRGEAVADQVLRRKLIEESIANRATSRPTLPVPLWEQKLHYASRLGRFSQSCEQGGPHHSACRMGYDAHRIDESDGIEAAGKTRTRWEKKRLGILSGTVAKEGESYDYKRHDGHGSGAPCQDHFYFEVGNDAVEREMPVGKRLFPLLKS
ncbi:unnamed protein product [Polarella glacialis]|nr:unnamed protein product [Polarella glacialis]